MCDRMHACMCACGACQNETDHFKNFFPAIAPCVPWLAVVFSQLDPRLDACVSRSNTVCTLLTFITRAHSFPRKNLTNSATNLVNSAAHRGKADEIPRLTAGTQLNFRGLIKS